MAFLGLIFAFESELSFFYYGFVELWEDNDVMNTAKTLKSGFFYYGFSSFFVELIS